MFRLVLVSSVFCGLAFAASTPRPLADLNLPTSDGKTLPLKQYKGKVVLIALISTTCKECVASLEILNRIQKDLGPRGAQVLAAAINDNAAYLLQPFVQRYRPIFPIGYLDQAATMRLADFKKDDHPFVPIFLFVDRKGNVRFQYFGNDPFFKQEERSARAIVEGLLHQ